MTSKIELPDIEYPPCRETTCVAIPVHDSRIDIECMKGVMASMPLFHGFFDFQSSLIPLGRNFLFNGFLQSPYEWLVLIDSDIGFTRQDMEYLLEGREYAICAPYARKDSSGEAIRSGLGFGRIHRSVLEVLREHVVSNLNFIHNGHAMHDFCPVGVPIRGANYLGEDVGFWSLVRHLGIKVGLETRCRLTHYGRHGYTLDPLSVL